MSIYEKLGLNEKQYINKNINIKLFLDSSKLKKEDKIILDKYCEKIICKYKLKNTDYGYNELLNELSMFNEILIVEVTINDPMSCYDLMYSICHILLYPVIIVYKYNEKFKLAISKIHIGKNDYDVNINRGIVFSSWMINNQIIGKNLELLKKIKNIQTNEFDNLKELYEEIYNIIREYRVSYTTIPKFVKLLKNTIGVEEEKKLREEILNECCKIVVKPDDEIKYSKDKLKKYEYEGTKGTRFLIDTEELWLFINKRDFYKKRLESRKIDSYLELTYRDYSNFY